jgi:putative SOS response-associated peptidase YedK
VSDCAPRYNIAPTQMAPVIRSDRDSGERRLDLLRWGLIPFWAKDESIGSKMINARSETVAEKPAFRKLLERRRCVVPADAFYEWKKPAKAKDKKQPFALRLSDDRAFGFAGLWDRWKGPEDAPLAEPLESYTILTTSPNGIAKQVHDRMPVMLISSKQWDQWLDGSITDAAALQQLFEPIADKAMRTYPVSARVNAPANEDAELLREVVVAKPQAAEPPRDRGLFE